MTYQGCHSEADNKIKLMIARRCGIRDICAITGYSKGKVQRTIARSNYIHSPKKQYYSGWCPKKYADIKRQANNDISIIQNFLLKQRNLANLNY